MNRIFKLLALFLSASATAQVSGHSPIANAGGPYSGVTNFGISFDGSASSDPQQETLSYQWNFGDGVTATGVAPNHSYSTVGSYVLSLSVTNSDGYTASASSQVTISQDCSSVSVGNFGALNGFVPSPADAWHTDISSANVDPLSNTIMLVNANDLASQHLHPDLGGGGAYGIPYTVVDSTPLVPINVTSYPGDSDITLFPLPDNLLIEGSPSDCSVNGDNHAIVLDKRSCVVYEMFQAQSCSTNNTKWSAASTAIWDLTENEHRPYGYTSVDAAGLSVFEGLVRYDEVAAGVVNHAIRFTAKFTKNNNNNGYFTAPATHASGSLWGTDNVMGMRIRMKADYDISALGPQSKVIAAAMKKYGMILADNGSSMYFQGTSDPRWNDDDLNGLKAVPSSAFEVVSVPLSTSYQPGSSSFYPNGPVYDGANFPTGNAPVISSFTASATSISAGQSVTLTPVMSGASYSYIDNFGFIRGPVSVSPTSTTTYTLTSRNAYGSTSAQVTVTVSTGATATLQFASIPGQVYGAAPFAVSASSQSSGAITYSILSGPATVAGNMVTLNGVGPVTVQASQAAAGQYPAATATTSFNVVPATPALKFNAIADKLYGVAPFGVTASSASPGSIGYAVVSGPATIAANVVTLTGIGTVTLQANQDATANYSAATAATSFAVKNTSAGLQIIAIPNQTYGVTPFQVSASSLSTGNIIYSVLSGPASVSADVLTITGAGTVTVEANQAAAGAYPQTNATTSFQVLPATPVLTVNTISTKLAGSVAFAPTASSSSNGTMSWTVSGPATLSSGNINVTGAGVVTVTASQAATGNYAAATASTSFTVQDFQISTPQAMTMQAGTTSSTSLSVSGEEGFTGTVDVTCSLSSTMFKTSCSATNVQLGSTASQGTATITVTATNTFSQASIGAELKSHKGLLFVALLTPLGLLRRRRKLVHLAILMLGLGMLGMTGCGSGIVQAAADGTYNLTITATSGTATHTTTIPVVIQ